MATYYSAPAFASFKTAYLQREVVFDVYNGTGADIAGKVGQVFSVTSTGASGASITFLQPQSSYATSSAAQAGAIAAVSAGMYIIAQGNQTLEYGHVPVENADYRYNSAYTVLSGASKKIAAFQIVNLADIEITAGAAVSYSQE